ncbi:hypothetical protein KIH74_26425 [Kineosporia sp. J2-2]|uniref:Chromosome segregation ATPase n=1 Tax=Kineosporia corallincola TaxID=2835133 RepID=A0ABS5TNE0_9ACTN|nr:hypothetical protein [Kineosporia corallincola]MBT0772510.1 hypothetical protein [Kineosporia corallincola]
MSTAPMIDRNDPHDIVGPRVLVGVQMVDISRLSAHPVPLTNGGLITVAGQGPKDSNGAGKSSFIAALSLLHADEQWRLAGGAPGSAELLFTAELAAQEARWANADHGFVIGVFADPAARTVEELEAGALTVWLRINRKSPYLSLRWKNGLHVPYGANDAERAAGVTELWNRLPNSNGRDDFHAGRLAKVLYGGQVRCVSFLSTSVRASPAANLLAQPLNELSPWRMFDAVATLTGLDRELEQEQALRSGEHARRVDVAEAEHDLATWAREMEGVEAGIRRRDVAREVLGQARQAWHSRCARHVVDGLERLEELRRNLGDVRGGQAEARERLAENEARMEELGNDDGLQETFRQTERLRNELRERRNNADTQARMNLRQVEELGARLRDLKEAARAADGRDTTRAREEVAAAQEALEAVISRRGAAEDAVAAAAKQIKAAQAGDDVAARELKLLQRAGIPAASVVDVLELSEDERAVWEPRLAPYRHAVTVAAEHEDPAREALADEPGAMLVLADGQPAGGLPRSTSDEFGLSTFLKALAGRAGSYDQMVDDAAGVIVVAGFERPLTGRDARVRAAHEQHALAVEQLDRLGTALDKARGKLVTATSRLEGAKAAQRVEDAEVEIERLREQAGELQENLEDLIGPLEDAEAAHTRAAVDRQTRLDKINTLRGEVTRSQAEVRQAEEIAEKLEEELRAVDVDARAVAWGATSGSAQTHLLSLPDDEQKRRTTDWNNLVANHLRDVLRRCFPDGTAAQEYPAELRELVFEQRWPHVTLEAQVPLVPDLTRALRTHLDVTAQQDAHDQAMIDQQRAQRRADLEAARSGLAESEQTTRAHRSVLAQGIKAKLKLVADEFDRLDREYGGYGAGLDYPEPEPPTEPDKPWRWSLTPRWRRAENQRMSSYNLRANTAQMDEKAVKLVCAAALAGGNDRPLLLILDELGRNLGKQHRREAVALFERIGHDRNITVIGALQDDMERYAIEASNLYIKLRRSSDAVAYNDPPIVLGDDANRSRVELLREWMSAYRPASRTIDVREDELDLTV